MVPYLVVFCDIVFQVFISFLPEYVEMVLLDSVSDPIKSHVCFSRYFLLCYYVEYAIFRCIVRMVSIKNTPDTDTEELIF